MKIVLTGSTGFVGSEVLRQLLGNSRVSRVTCLSRRTVDVWNPKLAVALQPNLSAYDDRLLARLADHSACIWALGGKAAGSSPEDYEHATHSHALAFARAVAARGRPFSLLYLGGTGAAPSEPSSATGEAAARPLKGRTEKDLARLASENPLFASYCFRPGEILPRDASWLARALLWPLVVRVDVVAAAMIRVALDGAVKRTLGNAAIKAIATR